MDVRVDEWMDRRIDAWKDRWVDGRLDGRMRVDGWVNG